MTIPLNVLWGLLGSTIPLALGLMVAWPLWRLRGQDDSGTLAGAGVTMFAVIGFILHEYYAVIVAIGRCQAAGLPCHFDPEPAIRYATFAGVGMAQLLALFVIGWIVTTRLHRHEG